MGSHPLIRRIAFAVRNVDAAKAVFEPLFGGSFQPSAAVASDEVRTVELCPGDGQPVLELVESVDEDGAIARFIRKRGEGVHHLSVAVADLEAAIRQAAAKGGRVVRARSYYRDSEGGALREAFLHPKDVHGVLLHLVEEA